MKKTETTVKTTSGLVQYFSNEDIVLANYNRSGKFYEIRDGLNGRELWHKGHKTIAGVIETIPSRGL